MYGKKVVMILAVCILLAVMVGSFVEDAHAQGDTLAKGTYDKDKAATKGQIALGVGSIFVMIAVVKFL